MAVVRKTILVPGNHVSPDGEVNVTPERIKRWADQFQSLKANGVQFPVPWGHQQGASPDNNAFLSSKFNAGYVKDLLVGPEGQLDADFEIPGAAVEDGAIVSTAQLADGRSVKTAIKEVSVGIFDKWTDGKGQTHEDIIGHVALTPLPVWAGQSGFQALATDPGDEHDETKVTYLSTVMLATNKNNDDSDVSADEVEAAAGTDAEGATDGPPDNSNEMFSPTPAPVDPNLEKVQTLCMDLSSVGCPLPPDTNPENFIERFSIAFGVLKAQLAKSQQQAEQQPKQPAQQSPVTEEQMPGAQIMMSTIHQIQSNPLAMSLANDEIERRTKQRAADVADLKRRGLKPHLAEKLLGKKIQLSTIVTKTGKLGTDEIDRQIALLKEVLPPAEFAETYLSTMADALQVVPSPADVPADQQPTETIGGLPVTPAMKAEIESDLARIGRA